LSSGKQASCNEKGEFSFKINYEAKRERERRKIDKARHEKFNENVK
jgi:hypothetical protein